MFVQTLMDVYIGQPHLDKNYKVSYLKPSKLHIVKKANLTTCVIYFKKSYLGHGYVYCCMHVYSGAPYQKIQFDHHFKCF